MLSRGFGFKNPEAFNRMVKGVRAAERLRKSRQEQASPGSALGQFRVQVKITSTTKVDDYYPGVFVFRDLEFTSPGTEWSEYPALSSEEQDNYNCYVQELNLGDLELDTVYDGYVAGVFDIRDGDGVPGPQAYNGHPLVKVNIGGGSSGVCVGYGWVADLTEDDCLRAKAIADSVTSIVSLSTTDAVTWEQDPAETLLTICGVEYTVSFTKGGCDGPCLTLSKDDGSGGTITFTGTRSCGGCNYAVFSFSRTALCGLTRLPGGPCANTVDVTVSWALCPGYYCVKVNAAVGCTYANMQVVEVTVDDEDTSDLVVCSGPYATEHDANVACGKVVVCEVEIPLRKIVTLSGGAFDGISFEITWDGVAFQATGQSIAVDCINTFITGTQFVANLNCDWTLNVTVGQGFGSDALQFVYTNETTMSPFSWTQTNSAPTGGGILDTCGVTAGSVTATVTDPA